MGSKNIEKRDNNVKIIILKIIDFIFFTIFYWGLF